MKTKLEMAHEFMLAMIKAGCHDGPELLERAWQYADAMQAEADKRNKAEAEQKRNAVREMLNADNTFLEKEGQHFDDVEWQPDWSQAPEWANWWVATADREGKISGGWFYENEPELGAGKGPSVYYSPSRSSILTDSFGYTGDWRESLRKRPQ